MSGSAGFTDLKNICRSRVQLQGQTETHRSSKVGPKHSNLDNGHELHFEWSCEQTSKGSIYHPARNLKDSSCKSSGGSSLLKSQVTFEQYCWDGWEGRNGGKTRQFKKGKSVLYSQGFQICLPFFHCAGFKCYAPVSHNLLLEQGTGNCTGYKTTVNYTPRALILDQTKWNSLVVS